MAEYIKQINGLNLAATEVVPGSALDQRIADIEEFTDLGAFEIVNLTGGADPVPDVANPSNKVIYLTKDSSLSIDDPYTEWIYMEGDPTANPPTSDRWEIIGTTSMKFQRATTSQEGVTILNSSTVDPQTGALSTDETKAVTALGVKNAVDAIVAGTVHGVVASDGTDFVNSSTHIATIPQATAGANSTPGNLGLVTITTVTI